MYCICQKYQDVLLHLVPFCSMETNIAILTHNPQWSKRSVTWTEPPESRQITAHWRKVGSGYIFYDDYINIETIYRLQWMHEQPSVRVHVKELVCRCMLQYVLKVKRETMWLGTQQQMEQWSCCFCSCYASTMWGSSEMGNMWTRRVCW